VGTVRFNKGRGWWYVDYTAADGTRVRQRVGSGEEGKRLAKQILRQREAEAQLGIYNVPASRTARFEEVAAAWLDRMRPPRVRAKTWEGYEDAVERLLPYFGGRRLGAITREDVEAYLVSGQLAQLHHPRQRKEPKPLSVTTLNYGLNVLRFIFRDAVDRGTIAANPAARAKALPKPARPEGRVQYLTPEQIDALLAVVPELFATMYRLAIDAGLRRGELLALRGADIDFTNRRLHVRRSRVRERDGDRYVVRDGPPKTKSSTTVIEDLAPSTVAALYALVGDRSERDYVFCNREGGPFDPDHVSDVFERHLRLAGIPPVGIHALRHTCATLAIARGEHPKAVQVRMRHADFGTTMDTYGHLMRGAFQGMGERLDAWLEGRRRAAKVGNNSATEPAESENAGPARRLEPAS
jgi:integrase